MEAEAAQQGQAKQQHPKSLALALSLRAYESAVAVNHKDAGATLERWRRVVALRQNRVLVPGRAAELYSQLISTVSVSSVMCVCRSAQLPRIFQPVCEVFVCLCSDLCVSIEYFNIDNPHRPKQLLLADEFQLAQQVCGGHSSPC